MHKMRSKRKSGRTFGRDDETATLARSPVHRLDQVDQLLVVLDGPVDLVVVARAEVDHDVLVALRVERERGGGGGGGQRRSSGREVLLLQAGR